MGQYLHGRGGGEGGGEGRRGVDERTKGRFLYSCSLGGLVLRSDLVGCNVDDSIRSQQLYDVPIQKANVVAIQKANFAESPYKSQNVRSPQVLKACHLPVLMLVGGPVATREKEGRSEGIVVEWTWVGD